MSMIEDAWTGEVEDPEAIAASAAHLEATEAAQRAAGVATHEDVEFDYFGFHESHIVQLDSQQWIEHTELNEGKRKFYLNNQNRDMTVSRNTGDMKVGMRPGDERHSLLVAAISGWQMFRGKGEARTPVPFSKKNLLEFLDTAPPSVIDKVEKDIRKNNPWLLQDASVEDLEKEMENLQEMINTKKKEEAGKLDS